MSVIVNLLTAEEKLKKLRRFTGTQTKEGLMNILKTIDKDFKKAVKENDMREIRFLCYYIDKIAIVIEIFDLTDATNIEELREILSCEIEAEREKELAQ